MAIFFQSMFQLLVREIGNQKLHADMLKYHLRPVFCILISILYNYTKSYSNLEGLVDQEFTEIQKKIAQEKKIN